MPITLDLPMPPSVNRHWRGAGRTVVRSDEYRSRIRQADARVTMTAQLHGVRQITGPFAADIVVQRGRGVPRDLDNFAKPILDYCESRLAVRDDRNPQDVRLRWARARPRRPASASR